MRIGDIDLIEALGFIPISSATCLVPTEAASVAAIAPKQEDGDTGDPGMISLSVDDLYQYSVAQTSVDTPAVPDNVDIHDKLSEGAAKIVPLGLDEFMAASNEFEKPKTKTVKKAEEHDNTAFSAAHRCFPVDLAVWKRAVALGLR